MQQDQTTATKCSETLSKCCKLDLKEQSKPSNCNKRQGLKQARKLQDAQAEKLTSLQANKLTS